MKKLHLMTKSFSLILGIVLFTACGGGGGGTSASTSTSSPISIVSGTVPGTLIEAFGEDGSYKSVKSTQNGTARHPFQIALSKSVAYRLVMTTNEDNNATKVVTPIGFITPTGTGTLITLESDTIDLGHIDLKLNRADINDTNGDGVSDTILTITVDSGLKKKTLVNDVTDKDGDGIVNVYEDDDGDGKSNRDDEDDDGDGILDINDNDRNNDGVNDNDLDGDGVKNSDDVDDDNDGQSDEEDSDDDNDGIPDSSDDDDDNDGVRDEDDDDNSNTNSGGGTTTTNKSSYLLTAWNDLGMHCMDGNDFSVFSVLPPYNNLHAQLKDKSGNLITTGVTVTYQSTIGVDGKINTSSVEASNGTSKTNFWTYATDLFGASLADNIGLTGNPTASLTPKVMTFNATHQWWEAEGIPITPYNDDGTKNYYPLVRVVAKDNTGKIVASVDTVLPVSDEMDCKRCHASNSVVEAKPTAGWVNNADAQKDYKYNILRLHDQVHPTAVSDNRVALVAKGYTYNDSGLEATAQAGTAVLCTACHKSNALPGVGIELKSFTEAIHAKHATVTDPLTNQTLGSSTNRTACYACHPGAATECLRGAMGDAKNADGTAKMQCQSCHGDMGHVGASGREGWLAQPNCQACHHDGVQETSAIDPATNTLRNAVDTRFATLPNTPAQGFSLYRFSTGHGDLQCEACHGSTHAIYPAHEADNKVSIAAQGHSGTIAECSACHTTVPNTITGGPHGMHPVGQSWIQGHEDVAENNPAQCKACHGADYRGSVLSKTWTDRTLDAEDYGIKRFTKGHEVSCYDCHNGPSGD